MEVAAKPNVGEVTMRLLSTNPRRISKARSLEAGTHAKRSAAVARLAQEELGRSQGTPHKVLLEVEVCYTKPLLAIALRT